MKKILLTALMAAGFTAVAQNNYNFTLQQQAYTDLEDAVTLNGGVVWDWDTYEAVAIPFDFEVNGQQVDRFIFDDDFFALLGVGVDYDTDYEGIYYMSAVNAFIQDRTYNTGVSSSPISYKIEGGEGSRILKLEVKNAGLEDAVSNGYDEDTFYVSFQIWLYEATGAIEYRYGSNNLNDDSILYDEDLVTGFGDETTFFILTGDSADPEFGMYTESTLPESYFLNAFPASGTVYTFTPTTTAGVTTFATTKFTIFPNPATSVLTLNTGTVQVSGYTITDASGKRVMQSNIPFTGAVTVNVENLAPGMYFMQAGNMNTKFIKN